VWWLLIGCGHDVPVPPAPAADPTLRWGASLQQIVTRDGGVDYALLRAEPEALTDFVGWIAEHGPESDHFRLLDDDRRLAWHLNAYNALVLWGVLQAGDIEGVRDVPAPLGPPGAGFFAWWRFRVDGERTSLWWYEQAVILATYEEPLAHAALNCASRSCPPLRPDLYRKDGLRSQLDDQMRRWVAGGGAVWREGQTFVFNAIFDWYADDFSRWAGAGNPCSAVRPYADEELARALDAAPGCPHSFAEYDWGLNDAAGPGLKAPAGARPAP